MHSFLLLGSSEISLEERASEICAAQHISPFDKTIVKREKSIGIEDIRNLQQDLILTPLKSLTKAAIIYKADTMTIDAQNAFLKTLEEPPPHTIILLLGKSKESFLPTVLSRCTIIQLHDTIATQQDTPNISSSFLNQYADMSLGEKLKQAESIAKTKETAVSWVYEAQLRLRENLLKTPNHSTAHILRHLSRTYSLLKNTNANTRVVIEHLFLSL
jgi:hypothetical protein